MDTVPNVSSLAQLAATLPSANSALVVAHPGHELRVYGWMEVTRPLVFVLTDGSGSGGEPRLSSTTRILASTAARQGSIYGAMSDREIYSAILDHDFQRFTRLADDLARELVTREIDCVVADAVEGYNPSHDVCRLVVNAAVRVASRARGVSVAGYDFVLVGAPDACPPALQARALWLRLDEAGLRRKLDAARCYPELTGEVERALEQFGSTPFGTECLRPVDPTAPYGRDEAELPFYERYGEQRVAAGVYDRVLRYRQHVLPLAEALWNHTEKRD